LHWGGWGDLSESSRRRPGDRGRVPSLCRAQRRGIEFVLAGVSDRGGGGCRGDRRIAVNARRFFCGCPRRCNVEVINWLFDSFCDSRVGSVSPAVIQTRRRQNTRLELCGTGPPTANFSGSLHEQRSLVAFFDLVCGLRGYVAVRTAAPTTPHSSLISCLRCMVEQLARPLAP
jgi:hypothetical protein